MKSVLISIQPKWVEKIASGKKTIEVRKSKPKLETPFKCYIYCTKDKGKYALHTYINSGYGRKEFGVIGNWRSGKEVVDVNSHLPAYRYNAYLAEGKVIGEFVCEKISSWKDHEIHISNLSKLSCVSFSELGEYSKGGKDNLYAWHISDLKIYDKPKDLSEFKKPCYINEKTCYDCQHTWGFDYVKGCNGKIEKAPQSWCYVEG